jgi:O-antigen ligase
MIIFAPMTNSADANRNRILSQVLLGSMAISLVLPIRANAIVTVLTSAAIIIFFFNRNFFDRQILTRPLIFLVGLSSLILLGGLIYSSNKSEGLRDLERYGFVVLFPVVFYLAGKSRPTLSFVIYSFVVACLGIIVYGFLYSVLFMTEFQRQAVFESGHTYFTDIISIHPTYLSIYLMFVFFFLIETTRTKLAELTSLKKSLLVLSLLIITGTLIFLRSQMELLIFALLFMLYVIILLKRRAWFVTFLLLGASFAVFLLDRDRVTTFFDTYGKNVSTAVDNRVKLWDGAINAIKSSPFFGAGTGAEQMALNKGYAEAGYREGIEKSYNAHNQYLEFWVRNGILELGVFIALLIYSFRQSVKGSNYTFLMFNMIFTLSMFTESCLNVHRGIVFFYFFLNAFIFLPFDSGEEKRDSQLL